MREEAGAVDMQPVERAADADAGLVGMLVRTGRDQIGEVGDCRRQGICRLGDPRCQAPIAERTAEQIGQRLVRALLRHPVAVVQIDRQRSYPGAVLGRGAHRVREDATRDRSAGRAADGHRLVLGDLQAERRQILHLAALDHGPRYRIERLLTLPTDRRTMHRHDIGVLDQRQRLPRVPWLPSRLLATGTPCRPGPPRPPVTGRWFAAVVAILRQPAFEGRVLGHQLPHIRLQRRQFGFEMGNAFGVRHARSLPASTTPS
jgi:hypothetical protein